MSPFLGRVARRKRKSEQPWRMMLGLPLSRLGEDYTGIYTRSARGADGLKPMWKRSRGRTYFFAAGEIKNVPTQSLKSEPNKNFKSSAGAPEGPVADPDHHHDDQKQQKLRDIARVLLLDASLGDRTGTLLHSFLLYLGFYIDRRRSPRVNKPPRVSAKTKIIPVKTRAQSIVIASVGGARTNP